MNSNLLNTWITIRSSHKSEANDISKLIASNITISFSKYHRERELEIWIDTYSPNEIERHIEEREVFVLLFHNRLCGTIQLDGRTIKGFYTLPKGVGFGNILMEFMVGKLKLAGHKWIELTSNEWAVGFYQKHHFEVMHKTITYYEGLPFEEFHMRREIRNNLKFDKNLFGNTRLSTNELALNL